MVGMKSPRVSDPASRRQLIVDEMLEDVSWILERPSQEEIARTLVAILKDEILIDPGGLFEPTHDACVIARTVAPSLAVDPALLTVLAISELYSDGAYTAHSIAQ